MAIKPTHSGKPNQSCLKKPIRTILKKQQTEAIGAIQKAFKDEVLSRTPTRRGLDQVVAVNTETFNFPLPKMEIKYTPDGSIMKKSLNKHLKNALKEAEKERRTAIEAKINNKLSMGGQLTNPEWDRMNELGAMMKNPFKGQFREVPPPAPLAAEAPPPPPPPPPAQAA